MFADTRILILKSSIMKNYWQIMDFFAFPEPGWRRRGLQWREERMIGAEKQEIKKIPKQNYSYVEHHSLYYSAIDKHSCEPRSICFLKEYLRTCVLI